MNQLHVRTSSVSSLGRVLKTQTQHNRISAATTEANGKERSRPVEEFKMIRQSVVNVGKMEILIASAETKEGKKARDKLG